MANQRVSRNDNISEIVFHIELANLKNFKLFKSEEIFVRGNPWYMLFKKDSDDDLSAFLYSSFKHKSNKSIIIAEYEISLLSWKSDSEPCCQSIYPSLFSSKPAGWGTSSFISWNRLMDPENGFVMDDKCRFEIRIKAAPLQDMTTDEWVKIDMIDSCDNCSQQKFRMKINKFYEFYGIGSHEIVFKDLSFHVCAYRCENNLSFQIQKIKINDCSLSFTLKLISYDANIKPIEYKEKFDANRFSSTVYHLSTWSQLTDPANKFIENNSFVIEVDLKMETDEPKAKQCRTCSTGNGAVFLECPICFGNLKLLSVSSLTCGHVYCTKCATTALQKQEKCPTCDADAPLKLLRPCYLPTV